MVYAIQHPFTGEMIYPYIGACWPLRQSDMLAVMKEWGNSELKDLNDAKERASVCGIPEDTVREGVLGIVLSGSLDVARKYAQKVYDKGRWPRFFFTKKGQGGIARKTYLDDTDGRVVTNLWIHTEVGHTDEAKKELKAVFSDLKVFDTPKPTRLIDRILQIATEKDSIILDSFAGSGTTAHAILNLNKQDGGNRKFILVEMEDYADDITAERVKRVIGGYGEGKSVEGTGGNFSYYELGQPMFIENDYLNEELPLQEIHRYIWYTETARPFDELKKEHPHLLGVNDNSSYYFFYDKDSLTTLNHEFLQTIKQKSDTYVIYADNCVLPKEFLAKNNIIFKKIPRDITRF